MISKDPAHPAKKRTPLILKVLLGVSVFSYISLHVLNTYRPETFMSENELLSKGFTESYKGPAFDILRVRCYVQRVAGDKFDRWTISYRMDGQSVQIEKINGINPCLVYAGKNPSFAILKIMDNPLGYKVMTTGEEKEEPYSTELINKLLAVSTAGYDEVRRQQDVSASWKESH